MFCFTDKYSLVSSGILDNATDYHSHILPGVDDGFNLINDAISALDYYHSLGIRKVILTPHIMDLFPNNNHDLLMDEYEKFCNIYQGEIEVQLGAEYMMDANFEKHLESEQVLTVCQDHILIECYATSCPYDFINRINRVMSVGYFIVLAHPERYTFLNEKKYSYLREMGVKLQLNLLSLLGLHGSNVQKKARSLLRNNYYDLWGIDLHSLNKFADYMNKKVLTKSDVCSLMSLKNKMQINYD